MSSILHKKAQFKKQVEDVFKDHQDLVRYTKNVLLVKRPIDFGVLLVLVSLVLYYFKDFNTSAISFFSFTFASVLILQVAITNFNFKFISRILPAQDSKESYDDIINLIVKIRFSFSESLSELNRFRHVNPTKFNIQTSLVFIILGTIGIFLSGFTVFTILVYTLLLLPYILFGKKPENAQGKANDILNNIIIVGKPMIDNLFKMIQQLYKQALDLATNKQQPSPGIPNPSFNNNNNNNNNINNNNINNRQSQSFSSDIGNQLNSNIKQVLDNNDQINKIKNQVDKYSTVFQQQQQQQADENQEFFDNNEETFRLKNSNNSGVLKKRY